jgi:hypothetical protein
MKNLWLAIFGLLVMGCVPASADVISFTAADVVSAMASQGAPLSDATNQWGLWAVRVMPVVGGNGLYTITGGLTNQEGWGVSAPNRAFGAYPYTPDNSAWFWDESGAEVSGDPPNLLYMIMDQPEASFTSYFGNTVTAVVPSSFFDVFFTLDLGANWDGHYQFVVDGSKYKLGTEGSPGTWVEDFFGGYADGGGLVKNSGAGYSAAVVPEPGSILFFGTVLAGLAGALKRKWA